MTDIEDDPFQNMIDERYNKMVSTGRVLKHRSEAAKKDRKRWECSVTDEEKAFLKSALKARRLATT